MPSLGRLTQLFVGCVVLGTGVAMLLTADLGSDGFSTLVNGVALSTGAPFWMANLLVSIGFLLLAAARRTYPGLGTVVQVVVVGATVSVLFEVMSTPETWSGQVGLLLLAFPVLAIGIATYLGSHTGAGPAEAAALAWDPPLPFRWSYSSVQLGGAVVGWLLGATIGVATVLVVLLLGPMVDLAARLLRLDVHQRPATPQAEPAAS
ncbi:hypothetical protein [Nocardioides coralli]|uniref:hypothetical protein n=1 Tax=Nocardioides coralli TaxID=2872154 RepID=UPI001CA3E39F|nr:hypothetical protein [Nocardioides coralli]QZY29066.1 hypothetical protein K6T13_16810 [Nocardioides coralli]